MLLSCGQRKHLLGVASRRGLLACGQRFVSGAYGCGKKCTHLHLGPLSSPEIASRWGRSGVEVGPNPQMVTQRWGLLLFDHYWTHRGIGTHRISQSWYINILMSIYYIFPKKIADSQGKLTSPRLFFKTQRGPAGRGRGYPLPEGGGGYPKIGVQVFPPEKGPLIF